jgi:hypothetical protein
MMQPTNDVPRLRSRVIQVAIPSLAFVLGLNLPRSFSLLTLICAAGLVVWRADLPRLRRVPVLGWSILLLIAFGLAYSIRLLQLEVWIWNAKTMADAATFVLLPAACLALGWLWRQQSRDRRFGQGLIVAFALGGLVYVSLALVLSRQPWWNLAEIFPSAITVPWGDQGMSSQNVRSVEQRAYAALAFLPVVPWLLWSRPAGWLTKALASLGLGVWGAYAIWSLNSPKLMAFALFFALLPCLLMLPSRRARWLAFAGVVSITIWLVQAKRFCDERLPMQLTFLNQIPDHPWGGRQIRFSFEGCPGQGLMTFAPPPNFLHLPHNIFLDQVNDVGLLPALLLLVACSLLFMALLQGFYRGFRRGYWRPGLALCWSVLCCILTQAIFQPFLYSDRLLFCLTFMFTGAMLAEFSADSNDCHAPLHFRALHR